MTSANAVRLQIEASLARRIPSALTPMARVIRPVLSTGIRSVDDLLKGGLPLGAVTEVTGLECSGRTSFALSFLAQVTNEEKVCAWIDASDAFSPESAAASGIELKQLLWVRCGVQVNGGTSAHLQQGFTLPEKYLIPRPVKKGLHGGGFGPHPRGEVRGMSNAIGGFLHPQAIAPRCAELQRRVRPASSISD